MQKGDVVGLVIVAVLLGGIGLFFALAPKAPQVIYKPTEITGSSLTVNTDQVDEHSVHVAAEIKQPGFVTINEAIGDAPGSLVGQTELLAAGSYSDLTVTSTGSFMPGAEYFVLLFVDNGDGVFEHGVDLPVMSNGQVVKTKFGL